MRYCCSFILRAFQPRPLHFVHVQDLAARLSCCLMKYCTSSLRSWIFVNMPPWLALRPIWPNQLATASSQARWLASGGRDTVDGLWAMTPLPPCYGRRCCPESHEGRTRWHSLVELPQKTGEFPGPMPLRVVRPDTPVSTRPRQSCDDTIPVKEAAPHRMEPILALQIRPFRLRDPRCAAAGQKSCPDRPKPVYSALYFGEAMELS